MNIRITTAWIPDSVSNQTAKDSVMCKEENKDDNFQKKFALKLKNFLKKFDFGIRILFFRKFSENIGENGEKIGEYSTNEIFLNFGLFGKEETRNCSSGKW